MLLDTAAVLISVPVAEPAIAQVAVNVAEPAAGRLTVLLILPLPFAVVQVLPPAPVQVQVQASEAGKVSATVAPVTVSPPAALLAVMVYVVLPPGTELTVPLVLVIDRSADRLRQAVTLTSSMPTPAKLAELSPTKLNASSAFKPAKLSARAVNSPQPADSLMVTAGLPTMLVIVAPSHSNKRVGVAPPTCWAVTLYVSNWAASNWYCCAQRTTIGAESPVRLIFGERKV